jgi:signal transduction histidine kinase
LDTEKQKKYYEVTYSPVYNQFKKIIGATAISKDVTGRKIKEQEIQNLLENKTILLFSLQQKQEEELRQTNEELMTLNNQLSTDRQQLLQTTEELQERNFELDQIMYKTSHDIRSPIASILGLLSLLEAEDASKTVKEYLGFLQKRVSDLDRFTKSMLNYGKTQRLEIEYQKIDFQKIIDECLLDLKYHPKFEKIKININIKKTKFEAVSDEFRLKIIFGNIISNAVKYQKEYQTNNFLKINININEDITDICFEDNGMGIEEKYIPKIFDMFFRATEKSDGSGLGMYIVKQTIKKLGGTISVQSKVNKGTKFCFILPNGTETAD